VLASDTKHLLVVALEQTKKNAHRLIHRLRAHSLVVVQDSLANKVRVIDNCLSAIKQSVVKDFIMQKGATEPLST